MFKPLKIKDSKVFFWSDLHIQHDLVLNGRGFKNVNEARNTLFKRWNNRVTNEDVGFLLGDSVVGAKDKGKEAFELLLYTLNYKELFVLPGNHPSGFSQVYKETLTNGGIHNEFLALTTEKYGRPVHLLPNYFLLLPISLKLAYF